MARLRVTVRLNISLRKTKSSDYRIATRLCLPSRVLRDPASLCATAAPVDLTQDSRFAEGGFRMEDARFGDRQRNAKLTRRFLKRTLLEEVKLDSSLLLLA